MSNQNNLSLFITKFRERKDKNGQTYFIGSIGLATAMIRKHKTKPDEWNLFLMEPKEKPQQQSGSGGFHPQSGGGYAGPFDDETIPF